MARLVPTIAIENGDMCRASQGCGPWLSLRADSVIQPSHWLGLGPYFPPIQLVGAMGLSDLGEVVAHENERLSRRLARVRRSARMMRARWEPWVPRPVTLEVLSLNFL